MWWGLATWDTHSASVSLTATVLLRTSQKQDLSLTTKHGLEQACGVLQPAHIVIFPQPLAANKANNGELEVLTGFLLLEFSSAGIEPATEDCRQTQYSSISGQTEAISKK